MIPIRHAATGCATPFVVYAIIAANVVVFAYQSTLNDGQELIFILRNAVVPRAFFEPVWGIYNGIKPGDYWPFVTSVFMHGGILHLALNMWALFMFGPALEQRFGRAPFLVFYLICGGAAAGLHTYLSQQSSLPLLGASGAIAGVIAGYAAIYPRHKLYIFPIPIAVPMLFFAVLFIALQLYQGIEQLANPLEGGGIAWWAHIGGFAAGLAVLPIFLFATPQPTPLQNDLIDARPDTDEPAPPPPNWDKGPWG